MRLLLISIYCLISFSLIAQDPASKIKVPEPVYDTTQFEIRSINSFKFCDINFPISRNCEDEDQANCCSFTAQVFIEENDIKRGALSCDEGTSLFWNYFDSKETLDANLDQQIKQMEPQMKNFSKTKIKCLLAAVSVEAYQIGYEGNNGMSLYKILAAGTINGKHVMAELHSFKKLATNKDIPITIRNVVSFN